jgi:hypothetical protein
MTGDTNHVSAPDVASDRFMPVKSSHPPSDIGRLWRAHPGNDFDSRETTLFRRKGL